MVLLIPTKELVFKDIIKKPSVKYLDLIKNEEDIWKKTRAFLEENNIAYLDALPSLKGQLDQGIQPYKVSKDGHPNEYGHKAIAELVYTRMMKINSVSHINR